MLRYVGTKLAIWIPSVLLVMLAVYALAFFGAGDPIKLIFLRAPGDVAYNPARIAAIRHSAGLDAPIAIGPIFAGLWHDGSGRPIRCRRSMWRHRAR